MTDTRKILIVDDEADMRTLLGSYFEDAGYATVTAVDGEEGFDKARAGDIDLITLDITMDNQSGVKMFRNLQRDAATDGIPVVMITGMAAEFKTFIEKAKQVRNPEGYFEKPVDRDRLLAKVKELVG